MPRSLLYIFSIDIYIYIYIIYIYIYLFIYIYIYIYIYNPSLLSPPGVFVVIYIWVSAKLTRLTSVALALSPKQYFSIDGFRFVEFRQFWVHFVKKTKF